MTQEPVPKWITASWERLYIIRESGSKPDRSVNVRNIQTPTLFGDCRIPKDRPAFAGAKSLADLTDKELTTLYDQQGFSGFTTVDGYITTWHHEIDYQPPDGSVDIGRIELSGGRNMYEHGVQATYTEHWWNLGSGDGNYFGVTVLRAKPDNTYRNHEFLSVNGDHFIYARNRPKDLPMADSLEELIKKTKASRKQILEYLDCEISHGFVLGGTKPWEIQMSTLPYKTGRSLEFAKKIQVDPKTGDMSHKGSDPDEVWSFEVNTLKLEDLVVLFPK